MNRVGLTVKMTTYDETPNSLYSFYSYIYPCVVTCRVGRIVANRLVATYLSCTILCTRSFDDRGFLGVLIPLERAVALRQCKYRGAVMIAVKKFEYDSACAV